MVITAGQVGQARVALTPDALGAERAAKVWSDLDDRTRDIEMGAVLPMQDFSLRMQAASLPVSAPVLPASQGRSCLPSGFAHGPNARGRQVGVEIPMDSDDADEENKAADGHTLLNILSRGSAPPSLGARTADDLPASRLHPSFSTTRVFLVFGPCVLPQPYRWSRAG